jgi:hypothetical protein
VPRNGKCKNMTKEILENISALMHITSHSLVDKLLNNDNILCLAVGDGKHPRSGILFALATKWHVISIDPIMDNKWLNQYKSVITNLECKQATANDVISTIDFAGYQYVIMVGVHSHANMFEAKRMIMKKKSDTKLLLLHMPCCKKIPIQFNNIKPIVDVHDIIIPSIKNRILMWQFNWFTSDSSNQVII